MRPEDRPRPAAQVPHLNNLRSDIILWSTKARAGELLALAMKEGQELGEGRVLVSAALGGREPSLTLLYHREMFQD